MLARRPSQPRPQQSRRSDCDTPGSDGCDRAASRQPVLAHAFDEAARPRDRYARTQSSMGWDSNHRSWKAPEGCALRG